MQLYSQYLHLKRSNVPRTDGQGLGRLHPVDLFFSTEPHMALQGVVLKYRIRNSPEYCQEWLKQTNK